MSRLGRRRHRLELLLAGAGSLFPLSPASAQPHDGDAIEEIVVTARRRAEPIQRVPVSVVALSEKELEFRSITNLRSLQNFVPNLTFAPSQNVGEASANIFIRGIGQEDFNPAFEPGVGLYIDGVYFARTLGTIMNVTDVARIEVLRGPQGTLFGKNTIGGAINITSILPDAEREHRASLILGNYNRIEARAVANEPLSNRLFTRLSVMVVSRDGYVHRLPPPVPFAALEAANRSPVDLHRQGDDHNQAGRLQLRWLLTDRLTADLSLDGSRRRNHQGAMHLDASPAAMFPEINVAITQGKLPGPTITSETSPRSLLETYATGNNSIVEDVWGVSATITRDFGSSSLKFIGAWRGLRSRIGTDTDGVWFNIAETTADVDQRQWSGELQLTGKQTRLSYTAGLFLFHENSEILPTSFTVLRAVLFTCGCYFDPANDPQNIFSGRTLRTSSYAAYTQGTYELTDKLSVTLGARYSHEHKTIVGTVGLLDYNLRPTDNIVGSATNRGGWNPFTWRAGLEYQARPGLMLYGSVSRGYKSGGFNARAIRDAIDSGFASFKPETALTYEFGLRSEWLDRRLRVNATLFHTDYRDIQLRQQSIVDGMVTNLIENAASARIRGAEIELVARLAKGLTLSVAYGHLDPRYLDVGQVPGLTTDTRFQRTPRHSFSASVHYERRLPVGWIELHGDYSYRSEEQFQLTAGFNDQKGYGLLGARVTFRSTEERWTFALFGTNLSDTRYRTAGRSFFSSVGIPRQFGVQVTSRF